MLRETNDEHQIYTMYHVTQNILTNDGTLLCTVNILCADFHPTVEGHLSEGTQLVKGSVCAIEPVDIAICDWPYFLHTWMASITVQEGKALDIEPPNLRMGGDLPLGVHRDRASHIIQRVGTSIRWSKLQSQPL